MCHYSAIHAAVTALIEMTIKSRNQREEMEFNWRRHDLTDMQKIF